MEDQRTIFSGVGLFCSAQFLAISIVGGFFISPFIWIISLLIFGLQIWICVNCCCPCDCTFDCNCECIKSLAFRQACLLLCCCSCFIPAFVQYILSGQSGDVTIRTIMLVVYLILFPCVFFVTCMTCCRTFFESKEEGDKQTVAIIFLTIVGLALYLEQQIDDRLAVLIIMFVVFAIDLYYIIKKMCPDCFKIIMNITIQKLEPVQKEEIVVVYRDRSSGSSKKKKKKSSSSDKSKKKKKKKSKSKSSS